MKIIFEEIVRREYTVKGKEEKIVVALGKPRHNSKTDDYCCPYKIFYFGKEETRQIFGIDGFQATHLALKTIDAELRGIIQRKSIELEWDGGNFGESTFPE